MHGQKLPVNWRGAKQNVASDETIYLDHNLPMVKTDDKMSMLPMVCLVALTFIVFVLFLNWFRRMRRSGSGGGGVGGGSGVGTRSTRRHFLLNLLRFK